MADKLIHFEVNDDEYTCKIEGMDKTDIVTFIEMLEDRYKMFDLLIYRMILDTKSKEHPVVHKEYNN